MNNKLRTYNQKSLAIIGVLVLVLVLAGKLAATIENGYENVSAIFTF